MNEWMHVIRLETAAVLTSNLPSEMLFYLCMWNSWLFSEVQVPARSRYWWDHVSLQDAVPPELLHVLQNSKDPLLQKLFPVTEKNQNNTKSQNKAAVVTVVSKFKVHPSQVSAVILGTFWIYHQQFDEGIHRVEFFCSSTEPVKLHGVDEDPWGGGALLNPMFVSCRAPWSIWWRFWAEPHPITSAASSPTLTARPWLSGEKR